MHKRVIEIIKKHIVKFNVNKHKTPLLGRWTIHENHDITFKKADMTNEDHCGICNTMRHDYIENNTYSKKSISSKPLK